MWIESSLHARTSPPADSLSSRCPGPLSPRYGDSPHRVGCFPAFDGLIDSGADDTVFADSAAIPLGIDLRGAEERSVHLVGRPRPIRVRYAPVQLLVTDGRQETYEWSAVVGFVSGRLHYNLRGQAGFLQFFDCNLRGEPDYETLLTPKSSFPGRQL